MQHLRPTFFSEMVTYGTIFAVGAFGFLACLGVLYANNFDGRQSILGFGLLFILLWEFICWLLKRYAETDEKRNVVRNQRKQIYWVYAWLFICYFKIWHIVLPAWLIVSLYKSVRDRKFRQVTG